MEKKTLNTINHIGELVERTKKTKSPYLAMITGMWYQKYGLPFEKNPFVQENNAGRDIIYLFGQGWLASKNAHDLSAGIIKKQESKDKARFEEMADKAKKAVGKFFGKK